MNSTITVLAIIPARGGSKGLPGKNIMNFLGKPLIAHAIDVAQDAQLISATIVSTDDAEIAEVAKHHGADVPFLRPANLASDQSPDIDYLRHALEWVEKERGWLPEVVVMLPPTTPSRTSKDIDAAIDLLIKSGASSVRTMVDPGHYNPYKMWKKVGEDGKVEHIFPENKGGVRRQDIPMYYMPFAAAYVVRSQHIKSGDLWGDDVRALILPNECFTDIDTLDDFRHAEKVVSAMGKTNENNTFR